MPLVCRGRGCSSLCAGGNATRYDHLFIAVFLTLREKLYIYYALAIAGYLLFFASIKGYSFQLLYPQFPAIHARALLVSMPEPVVLDKLAIELHPRFCAASYPEHGDNAAVLVRNAHVGMEITPNGPYETGIYSQEYDIYSESRLTLMSDLREALQEDRTELYYQPKLWLASDFVIGLEALIRWKHAERGWVLPADFIPLAEDTGVITQLTRWAINRGIRDLASLSDYYPEMGAAMEDPEKGLARVLKVPGRPGCWESWGATGSRGSGSAGRCIE